MTSDRGGRVAVNALFLIVIGDCAESWWDVSVRYGVTAATGAAAAREQRGGKQRGGDHPADHYARAPVTPSASHGATTLAGYCDRGADAFRIMGLHSRSPCYAASERRLTSISAGGLTPYRCRIFSVNGPW